jgi:hypothetical protein
MLTRDAIVVDLWRLELFLLLLLLSLIAAHAPSACSFLIRNLRCSYGLVMNVSYRYTQAAASLADLSLGDRSDGG